MLDEMKTREQAEKYIDDILNNPDFYNFDNDEEREMFRESHLKNWEGYREHDKLQQDQLRDHIVNNWDEEEFKNSFKNWDEMSFLEQSFFKAIAFFENETLNTTFTREDALDMVITRAREILPQNNEMNSLTDRLNSYSQALRETGYKAHFSADDVFMYVQTEKVAALQRQKYDDNILTMSNEGS